MVRPYLEHNHRVWCPYKINDIDISSKNFVLLGDFNYRVINWAHNCCDATASVDFRLFLDCINGCFITQHVDFF